jgi:hypothetical protein
MTDLVPVTLDDGTTILIEASASANVPQDLQIQEAASPADAAERALDTAAKLDGSIRSFCGRIVSSLNLLSKESRPKKATIIFGLSISAEGSVYVVKSTGEASISITAEWEFSEDYKR